MDVRGSLQMISVGRSSLPLSTSPYRNVLGKPKPDHLTCVFVPEEGYPRRRLDTLGFALGR